MTQITVTPEVQAALLAVATQTENDLDMLRAGKGDPLASLEESVALLRLLASGSWGEGTVTETHTCRHCGHGIALVGETWVAPDAGTDVENGDGIWRESCPDHADSFTAEHEPSLSHAEAPLDHVCATCGEPVDVTGLAATPDLDTCSVGDVSHVPVTP